jgi:hypothetical protein
MFWIFNDSGQREIKMASGPLSHSQDQNDISFRSGVPRKNPPADSNQYDAEGFFDEEEMALLKELAGDIIGVFDPGIFLIGDTICSYGSSAVQYEPLPQFPPEQFGRMAMLNHLAESIRFSDGRLVNFGGAEPSEPEESAKPSYYLTEFRLENGLPIWRYEIDGVVLEKHGVPARAIVALPSPVKTTEAELKLVGEAAHAHGWRRVILVTSPQHSRRVKLVWRREAPSSIEGLVRVVPGDDFLDGDWWRKRRQAETVLHEYLGLTAIYLGISHLLI